MTAPTQTRLFTVKEAVSTLVGDIDSETSLHFKSDDVEGTGQAICTEKFNKTFILQEGKPSEEETDEFDYDIFIAPKDAIYFIHGQVTMADGKGKVYLFWKLKSSRKIKTNNGTCPEITFATEVKLLKGGRVYLVFNVGKPNLKESTFSVYELAEQ
ncbi:uncharacterized protein ACWYII_040992 isoform 2-T2 [Salvelinus alpinus]